MAKKNLSEFANYCRDRNIGVLFRGRHEKTLYVDVYFPRYASERVRRKFEQRLRADNAGYTASIEYL